MQPAQEATGELPIGAGGGLTILEAETGSGKTEAALLHFAQLFQAGLVDGLYFALPTRTAATQIHARVLQAVKRAFPGEDAPPVLLASSGSEPLETRKRRLDAMILVHAVAARSTRNAAGLATDSSVLVPRSTPCCHPLKMFDGSFGGWSDGARVERRAVPFALVPPPG